MVVFGISSRSSLYIQERCVSKQKETYVVWRGRGSLVHHQYVWSRSRRLRPLRFLRTENNVGEEFLFSFFSFLLYSTRCPWESCVFHFSHFELYFALHSCVLSTFQQHLLQFLIIIFVLMCSCWTLCYFYCCLSNSPSQFCRSSWWVNVLKGGKYYLVYQTLSIGSMDFINKTKIFVIFV